MIRLRLFHTNEPSRQIDQRMIGEDPVTIGRDAAADWVVVDPNRALSRRHCTVRAVGNGIVVSDLSANGTFVDDKPEPIGKGGEATVAPGGSIHLGPFTASVEAIADVVAPAKPGKPARGSPALFDPPAGMDPAHEPARPARIDPFASQLAADPLLTDHKPTDRIALGAGDAWERPAVSHAGDWQAARDHVDHEKLIGTEQEWAEAPPVERDAGFGFDGPFERPPRAAPPPAHEAIPADWAAEPATGKDDAGHPEPAGPLPEAAAAAPAADSPPRRIPKPAAKAKPQPVPTRLDSDEQATATAKAAPAPAADHDSTPEPPAAGLAPPAPIPEAAATRPAQPPGPPQAAKAEPEAQAKRPARIKQPAEPARAAPTVAPATPEAGSTRAAAATKVSGDLGVAGDVAPKANEPARPAAVPPPTRSVATAAGTADDDLFDAFCAGAQLTPTSIAQGDRRAAMTRLGEVYRQMVLGLADLMGERTALKNEYRLSRTMVQPEGNNPFKWVPPQRLALEVLRGGGEGFNDGSQAVVDSFHDVKTHIYCVLAGMRAAVDATFTALAPATIETAAEARSYLLKGQRDAALWADFVARFDRLRAEDVDGAVNRAFGAAYEQQLTELDRRAVRPGEGRDPR